KQLLGDANSNIGRSHIPEKRYQDVVIRRDRCQVRTIGGLDATAEFAPKIQFPSRLEGKGIGPKVLWFRISRGYWRCRAGPVEGQRSRCLLHLRIKLANGDPQHCARLQDLGPGAQQGEILVVSNYDELVEHGVMEGLPPIPVFFVTGIDRAAVRPNKLVGQRCWLGEKIWTDN